MVTYGGEQSLDRYLAISARGVPFNVAHAAGNVVLALAAGPALVRMISRYRSRFEFDLAPGPGAVQGRGCPMTGGRRARRRPAARRPRARGALALPAQTRPAARPPPGSGWSGRRTATAASAPPPAAPRAPRSPAGRCWGWRAPAATRSTFDAAGTRRSATCARRLDGAALDRRPRADHPRPRGGGRQPAAVRRPRPGGELRRRRSRRLVRGPGEPDRVRDPRPARGGRSRLGARRARPPGCATPRTATAAGASSRDAGSDPDSTGAALQALAAAGGGAGRRAAAPHTCAAPSERDGGFALAGGGPTNSQSTAWAIQGLVAAGANPAAVRATGGTLPSTTSADRQAADGHYRYSSSSDQTPVWVTGPGAARRQPQGVPARRRPARAGRWPIGAAGGARERDRRRARRAGGSTPRGSRGSGHRAPGRERRRLGRAGSARRGAPSAGLRASSRAGEPVSAPVADGRAVER